MSDSVPAEAAERASDELSWPSRALKTSRWLALESLEEGTAVVFNAATSARLRVSRPVYELVRRFKEPKTVAEALGRQPEDAILDHVRLLLERGFLVDAEAEESPRQQRRRTAVSHPLFNGPTYRRGAEAAVGVLGVPYDLASPAQAGMREGPSAIRLRSFDFEYQVDLESGRPKGWFDVTRERRLLEGVTFADWGDAAVEHGESQSTFFSRVGDLIADIVDSGALPVLLGGDHSVTYPVVDRLQRREPLAVLHLDAHTDFDPSVPESVVNANCVALRMSHLPNVERLVQVGHRGFTINPKVDQAPPGVEIVTAARCRREGAPAVREVLPEELPVYITLDLNVLDPIYAPGTAHPTPGGFTLDELIAILDAVARHRRVVGFDLVEMHPGRDPSGITAIAACHLLLAGLGAMTASR